VKPTRLNVMASAGLFMVSLFLAGLYARDQHEINKTFKDKKMIQLNTFSGDCLVKKAKGKEIEIHFIHSYSKTNFEPLFLEEGDKLILKEKFHLSGSGDSTWNLAVPDNTAIQFQSISGNFTAEGVTGDITVNTVSGDVAVRDCKGESNLKSVSGQLEVKNLSGKINLTGVSSDLEAAGLSGEIRIKTISGDVKAEELEGSIMAKCPSGDIEISDAKGEFEIKVSSGDINVQDIVLTGKSYFEAASGDVLVVLGKSAEHDLTLECASGDAILNYNGNPVEGSFEFKTATDHGQIISPFPFENEEEVEKWGKKYVIKYFKRELDVPKISIHTGSGKAELKLK
jgi:DUF4097 and DUF4098 domain-containing protein YvlB